MRNYFPFSGGAPCRRASGCTCVLPRAWSRAWSRAWPHYQRFLLGLGIVCLFCYLRNAQGSEVKTWTLRGQVLDERSRGPLAGVTVSVIPGRRGPPMTTRTDADGRFRLDKVPEEQQTLQFALHDYQAFEKVVDVGESTPEIQIVLQRVPFQLEKVQVYDSRRDISQFEKTTDLVLSEVSLPKQLGMTLADTLADEVGITQRTMGRAVARPVIRGLGGDRLLILENGARTGDKSASSADHAVAFDPTSAERVEVTRGPASLIYGSSTLGGVVNVKRNSILDFVPQRADTHLTFQSESVNSGRTANAGFVVPLGDFVGAIEWNRRIADDIQTPLGTLGNTSLSTLNFLSGASFVKPWGNVGISGGSYQSDYGIPGSPEGHLSGVNIALDRQRYEGQLEYRFDTAPSAGKGSSFYSPAWIKKIKLQTAYTRYQHQELEANGTLGVEFGVLTYNFSAMAYVLDSAIAGVWGEYRDHATGGFYWTPHTREFALAGFYLNQRNFDRFTLQGAIRYDIRRAEPFHPGTVIRAGLVKRRDFQGVSGAVSGIYHWLDRFSTGATLMKTFRAPGIEELFSDGPHLAVYAYEVGNAELDAEHGYGSEVFARYAADRLKLDLALFRNQIQGYLIPTNTGEKEWGSGPAGWLWIYQYMGHDVIMDGVEMRLDAEVLPRLNVQMDMSYVNGTIATSGQPLERMPPLNGKLRVSGELLARETLDVDIHFTTRFSAGQTRLGEFEEPTDGYLVYDAGGYLSLSWWKLQHLVVFEVENLLDTIHHAHLSRIKSVMPEPGRNVKFLYQVDF